MERSFTVVVASIVALTVVAVGGAVGVTALLGVDASPVITVIVGFTAPTVAALVTLVRVQQTGGKVDEVKELVVEQAELGLITAEHTQETSEAAIAQAKAVLAETRAAMRETAMAAIREAIQLQKAAERGTDPRTRATDDVDDP